MNLNDNLVKIVDIFEKNNMSVIANLKNIVSRSTGDEKWVCLDF